MTSSSDKLGPLFDHFYGRLNDQKILLAIKYLKEDIEVVWTSCFKIKLNIKIPSAVRLLVRILLPLVKAESLNVNLNLA